MNFNQKELEYLLTCLNFHYAENDNIKEDIIDINAELCKKLDKQRRLQEIESN